MKNTLVIALALVLALGIFSCRKKGEKAPDMMALDTALFKDSTTVEFVDPDRFNFDTINQGDKVEHNFRIKNTGKNNLVIARAFGSCGCTVPEYPKDPVKPGETATIHVTFNSTGKPAGNIEKNVTIVCNTSKRNEMLYLDGFIVIKK